MFIPKFRLHRHPGVYVLLLMVYFKVKKQKLKEMTFDIQSHSPCTKDFLFQRDKFKKWKSFYKDSGQLTFKGIGSLSTDHRLLTMKYGV